VSARVEIQLATMLRRFGLDPVRERERSRLELMAAEVRCARCAETTRCRRFLLGEADEPGEFCPNAGLFARLAPRRPRLPWWRRLFRGRAAATPPEALPELGEVDLPTPAPARQAVAPSGNGAALVRITLEPGRPTAYRRALADGVRRALAEAYGVPEDGRVRIVTEAGRQASGAVGVVMVEVTAADTRSAGQKRRFCQRLTELLAETPGVAPGDLVVSLVDVPRENWFVGAAA
jgi:phenylpyruvate tautomerase PptA (4-oxalocrotonate tautomerase family)